MFRKREMAETITRQGESIIALNNRITQLNQKVENQKAVISEQIEELIKFRSDKDNAEIRAVEFARKLKKIEDIMKEFSEEDKINKQVAINFYTKLKNVLAKSDQTNN